MILYNADMPGKTFLLIMKTLNEGIYNLISTICQVFMDISNTSLFTNEIINGFLRRIYVVIGILMLFKLAFSLLNAIINPDVLTDKEKGLQKIIPRTVIVLIMLILSPMVFEKALQWQGPLASVVPKLIIGKSVTTDDLSESNEGELLAATALKAFIHPSAECESVDETTLQDTNTVDGTLYLTSTRCTGNTRAFSFQFNGFISVIVGIIMVVILTSYCIDIAIRTIKIGLLRVLAPIPIISYIDPKSEKSGAFGNWIKECVSTYVEIFIKLAVLYFVLYILSGIVGSGQTTFEYPSTSKNLVYIQLFLILGSFFFMGKAAEFLCNILGVKKPDTKGGWLKGLAGIGAALGIGAAGVSGAFTNFRGALASQDARKVNRNFLTALGSGALGLGSGLLTGASAVAGAQKGKMNAAIAAAYKRNTRYATAAASGATLFGKAGAALSSAVVGQTSYDNMQRQYDKFKDDYDLSKKESDAKKALYDHLVGEGVKKRSNVALTTNGKPVTFGNTTFKKGFTYDQFTNAWETAKQHGDSTFTVGGETLLTYGADTKFADAKMKEQLGNIFYGTTADPKDIDKIRLLASEAEVSLPASPTGFTKSVKDGADAAADKATSLSTQMRQLKEQMDIPKANADYINKK